MTSPGSHASPAAGCLAAVLFVLLGQALSAEDAPRVLVLSSYHRGFAWSDAEESGLLSALDDLTVAPELYVEYLDAKRRSGATDLDRAKAYLDAKYRDERIDLIVALDNPALDLLVRDPGLLAGAPVVFVGVSDYEPLVAVATRPVTGVAERMDVRGTIEIMLALHPRTRSVLVLDDDTLSGVAARREAEALVPVFARRVAITFLPPSTFDEAAAALRSLAPGTLVLIHSYSTDTEGRSLSLAESTRLLTDASTVPVYGVHETRLGHGIVGGSLLGGRADGKRAARMAARVLGGVSPSSIPVDTRGGADPGFDYRALRRHGIPLNELPPGSVILNRPTTLLERQPGAVVAVAAALVALGALVALLGGSILSRRRAEEALRWSEERYRIVSELSSDFAYALAVQEDGSLSPEWVTDAFERITGYASPVVAPPGFWLSIVYPEDREIAYAHLGRARTGKTDAAEYRIVDYRGHVHWIRDRARGVGPDAGGLGRDPGGGRDVRVIGASRDVTDERAAEQTRQRLEEELRHAQKMEGIGRLAGGVAHDFNNLITIIGGYGEMAAGLVRVGDDLWEPLQEILGANRRAAALTRQLLAFGRRQVLAPVVLDLNHVVADLKKMLMRLIGEDVELVTRHEPRLWSVYADRGQLEQVLLNLVLNARDAMPEGGTITIATANLQAAGPDGAPRVHISVRDTGRGMDTQTRARVFEPFFTTKAPGKGTGLGLATAYGIVRQTGGDITVSSQPGHGSVFEILLPPHVGPAASPEAPDTVSVTAAGGSETILVVEDDETLRALMVRGLRERGYRLMEAADGIAALDAAQGYPGQIDVLVTDLVMPRMGGLETATRMRKARPGVRILWVTGHGGVAPGERPPGEPIGVLAKPFSTATLAYRVRGLLDAGVKSPVTGPERQAP